MRRLLPLFGAVLATAMIAPAAHAGTMTLQHRGTKQARTALIDRTLSLGLKAQRFRVLPFVLVHGTPSRLRKAARLPGVRAAHRVGRRIEFMLDRSVPLVFGGDAQPTYAATGDGLGQTIAIVDSGVDGTHPDLIDQVKHNVHFTFDSGGGLVTFEPRVGVAVPCPGPCNTDVFGHGTHVAGVAAGAGSIPADAVKGVAPGADLVGLALSRTGTTLDWYALAAFDYILAHPELSIDVVNNSWYLPAEVFDPTDPINVATKAMHDAGITVVFAAGNFYGSTHEPRDGRPEGSSVCEPAGDCKITTQSVAPWTISVAAGARVWDGGYPAQRLADFSSRGDAFPQTVAGGMQIRYWPTITAPGTGIIGASSPTTAMNPASCHLIGDIPRCNDRTPIQNVFYVAPNGTSMAAPHVAGAVAVIQDAAVDKLGRRLTPDEVKQVIEAGATAMSGIDGLYDICEWEGIPFIEDTPCGQDDDTHTQQPYEPWQVGAGYLNVPGAIAAIDAL